uniref:BTB domain-containing protein n=1 Tax=Panagrolaimus davidi TaxID=227884 RepID=A0A914R0J4_9BILA
MGVVKKRGKRHFVIGQFVINNEVGWAIRYGVGNQKILNATIGKGDGKPIVKFELQNVHPEDEYEANLYTTIKSTKVSAEVHTNLNYQQRSFELRDKWEQRFDKNMAPIYSSTSTNQFKMDLQIPATLISLLINFFHFRSIPFPSLDDALDLYLFATKISNQQLQKVCLDGIKEKMSPPDVVKIWKHSKALRQHKSVSLLSLLVVSTLKKKF